MMLPEKVWENLKSGLQTTKDLSSLKDRIEASKEQVFFHRLVSGSRPSLVSVRM